MASNWLYIDAHFPRLGESREPNERIDSLQEYLYMLVEQLRYSFNNIDESNMNRILANQITTDSAKLADFASLKPLSMTYTTNSYISEESFNSNMKAYAKGGALFLLFNCYLSTALPTDTTNVEIGRISGWSAAYAGQASLAGRSSSGNLVMQVAQNGTITIGNASGSNCSGYYRTSMVVPEA